MVVGAMVDGIEIIPHELYEANRKLFDGKDYRSKLCVSLRAADDGLALFVVLTNTGNRDGEAKQRARETVEKWYAETQRKDSEQWKN